MRKSSKIPHLVNRGIVSHHAFLEFPREESVTWSESILIG